MKRTKNKMNPVRHWVKQIDRLLEKHNYKWAYDTLEGIKETIQENQEVTRGQIKAIQNITWGKNAETE